MKTRTLLTILIAGLALSLAGCNKSTHPTSSNDDAATSAPAPTTAKPSPDLEQLKGTWVRPDGGYVLEIRSVATDGKADAAYFNPSPIHVARGLAYREGGETKLFIELRDVNYPGCTYTLTLDVKRDQLSGQYYQAAMQETYDVFFNRRQ